jgi:hypothetical protein
MTAPGRIIAVLRNRLSTGRKINGMNRELVALAVVVLFLLASPAVANPVQAHANNFWPNTIHINGRYSGLTIGIQIPQEPKWAHDVVLNATIVWNEAQKWYQHDAQDGQVYRFYESRTGNVTVSFNVPAAYSGFPGFTEYQFAPFSKSIISAEIFLDQSVFSPSQENNSTAQQYAFRLALHELGHVLGLGHVTELTGNDVMDPRVAFLATQQSLISTLDLYAIHTLALGIVPLFIFLPSSVGYQLIDARDFLTKVAYRPPLSSIWLTTASVVGLSCS